MGWTSTVGEGVGENGTIWGRSSGVCGEKWLGGWY